MSQGSDKRVLWSGGLDLVLQEQPPLPQPGSEWWLTTTPAERAIHCMRETPDPLLELRVNDHRSGAIAPPVLLESLLYLSLELLAGLRLAAAPLPVEDNDGVTVRP